MGGDDLGSDDEYLKSTEVGEGTVDVEDASSDEDNDEQQLVRGTNNKRKLHHDTAPQVEGKTKKKSKKRQTWRIAETAIQGHSRGITGFQSGNLVSVR